MTDATRNGFTEIDKLIDGKVVEITFPYTTRQLAKKYGLSNSTVWQHLKDKGLVSKGHRWIYKHNPQRHE